MEHLRQLLAGPENAAKDDPPVKLDRAALDLARIQYPALDHQPFLEQINALAASLGDRLRNFNDGRDFVEQAQKYLFEELGFHANESEFFDPRNSCLNQVLERRTGIPITLSLLYMEIARRLQMPVFGIALPNRFIVQFDDGRYNTYVDPFGGGRRVSVDECFALAGATAPDPALLARASNKQILMRMLQNLHRAYMQARDFERAVVTLDYLLIGAPQMSAWLKLRGALNLELKHFGAAGRDLQAYLDLEPQAGDGDAIRQQLQSIRKWLAQNN
ncbi:MAG: transglutaminase-like domain-containing protein [Acidobacteriota bacterium]